MQWHGARGLLWAILIDGIETYCRAAVEQRTAGRDFRETELWIFSPDLEGPTGFARLCEVFGLNVRQMRRELRAFRDRPRRELLERLGRGAA